MAPGTARNPFRIHGVVEDEYFTNRAEEVERIVKTLREPGAKLLVYGPRRMGKTSALARAASRIKAEGGYTIMADLSTASSVTDIGNRILEAAARSLGRRWRDLVQDFVERLQVTATLTPDPVAGIIIPSLDVHLRRADLDDQRNTLGNVLDAMEGMARDRDTTIGIVLDEFQEISKFGGESAEWHLRGVLQRHHHVSYVLSGSATHVIERMIDTGRAFYGLLDQLYIGPIDPSHLTRWIDSRMEAAGVATSGVGKHAIRLVGPRTGDILQLARKCFDRTRAVGTAGPPEVADAFREILEEEDDLWRSLWEQLTPHQQNVLRAVAAGTDGLTTKVTLERFSLGSSGSATNSAAALVEVGRLLKAEGGTGYGFDSPYFRGWVMLHALADIGLLPPSDFGVTPLTPP